MSMKRNSLILLFLVSLGTRLVLSMVINLFHPPLQSLQMKKIYKHNARKETVV